MSFSAELQKIPPVTRFLCGSTLAVSLPVMLQLVSPYKVLFVPELVMKRFELWRPFTSFFLGPSGLSFVFNFVMLYRTSDSIEASDFMARSPDYAWQLLLASGAILAINLPRHAFVHHQALLMALVYLSSKLAPPGASTSIMGLLTIPVAYFPYALIAMDLLMGGPSAAASATSGAIVGHLWWWSIWHTRTLTAYSRAPAWLKRWVSDGPQQPGSASAGRGGVHVVPPRNVRQEADTVRHHWGSGNRLG